MGYCVCLFARRKREKISDKILIHIKVFRLGERIIKFLEVLRYYRNNRWIFLKVIFMSLLGQVSIILMTYQIVLALKLNISISYLFLVIPVTFLLTLFPSINGLGVRDGGFVFLLGKIGITSAAALSISFLSVIVPMIISIFGGILFLFNKEKVKIIGIFELIFYKAPKGRFIVGMRQSLFRSLTRLIMSDELVR